MPSDIHDQYDSKIHINGKKRLTSFRKGKIKKGKIRKIVKTLDDSKYNAIRAQYWKDRLKQIEISRAVHESERKAATATFIDDKVVETWHEHLSKDIRSSFLDGQYRTVITTEDIILYRVYGGHSGKQGAFLTTEKPVDRTYTKVTSALLPEWRNTKEYYCEVQVPKGTVINIGKAASQRTSTGAILKGGGDQVVVSPTFVSHASNYGNEYVFSNFGEGYRQFDRIANELEE